MSENESTEVPSAAAEPVAPPAVGDVPQEEKTFGMLAHLAALAGFIIPFGNIIGPLVIWLMKKDTMPFVNEQGKEAVNFQITISLAVIVCFILVFVIIGIFLLPIVGLLSLIFTIVGTVKASNGEHYTYPFAIRLIK